TLLLDKKLGSQVVTDKAASAESAVVARAKTLTALRQLDPLRKGLLIQFLYEAQLITGQFPILSLRDADLSSINLGSNTSLNSLTNSVYGPGPVGESNHCHLE